METGGNSSISDWDRPFTDEELDAIEAAFQSATSSSSSLSSSSSPIKLRHVPIRNGYSEGGRPTVRRLLPESISGNHRCGGSMRRSDSLSLTPCRRNLFFNSYNSYSPAKLMRYPAMAFKGCIVYSRTVSEVENAAKELLKLVETRMGGTDQVVLGFDIEWRPSFIKGVSPGKAAVMQICGDISHCYVMHIIHSGIPQYLRSLLEDPTYVKVGVGIGSDATKVSKDHKVSIQALEDLSSLANQKLGGDLRNWSLQSLTEMLICKQLPKLNKIRLGNWEADVLSKEQLQYAATDAFASWLLYQALKSLPDATNNKSQELENVPKQ
ncbi:LOW QUALITY PROTEIN: 3'-5' exonuclease-like [Actinidia eriantha]|uniref:LOW QUALITY PROTEIN: 3'-5' exonuclease-like n=1 Tax=Actinidia eriantha TaxID=165200 RepID=UPI002583F79B|nr:LOW QUALITY PROTEIN: 3'-5' exonuclease-like [Actinidia eriantha]